MSSRDLKWPPELFVLLAATGALFAASVNFGFLAWDDPQHLVDNPLTAAPLSQGWTTLLTTPSLGYPAPLTVLGWALQRRISGLVPSTFHAVNVVLHLLNVALVYAILRRMTIARAGALLAASLVAMHPLVAEPVAWVTGRKDLQAALFVLLGCLAIVNPRPRWMLASLFGVAALLSKPTTVIVPLLYYVIARAQFPTLSRAAIVRALAPLASVAVIVAIIGARGHAALGAVPDRSLTSALADVVGAWCLQTTHVVWPADLFASYYRGAIDPSALAYVIGAVALIAVVLGLRSSRPFVRAGCAWAVIAFFPVAGVLANRRWVADSYMYLPLVGIAIAVAAFVREADVKRVALGFAPIVIFALVWTLPQVARWSSNASLWAPVVEHYPDEPAAHTLYGLGLQTDERWDDAAQVYLFIAQRWPDRTGLEANQAWAFLRRGLTARAVEKLTRGAARRDPECIAQLRALGLDDYGRALGLNDNGQPQNQR